MSSTNSSRKLKHRACDECRQRKLACSKDSDGCSRCKKENIACHFSEQKQMGRPRKRQFIETETTNDSNSVGDVPGPEPAQPYFIDDLDLYNGVEDFLDASFLSLPYNALATSIATTDGHNVRHVEDNQIVGETPTDFGNLEKGGFSLKDGGIPTLSPETELSSTLNLPLTNGENLPHATVLVPCGCLSAMYLSLAALQQLPSDIVTALRTVRGGAATASECIWCPQCGAIAVDEATPPIELFQNTMLLGTMIPVVANGYARLLQKIDEETEIAIAAGQTKTFRFEDYGGFFGNEERVRLMGNCDIGGLSFKGVEMPAQQWRTTVRALLRLDVYGHEQNGFKHKGLKDLITELELRQTIRHDILDSMEANAHSHNMTGHGLFRTEDGRCIGDKTRGCMNMLQMAKVAIDNLIIL